MNKTIRSGALTEDTVACDGVWWLVVMETGESASMWAGGGRSCYGNDSSHNLYSGIRWSNKTIVHLQPQRGTRGAEMHHRNQSLADDFLQTVSRV
ncbi:hypothetical protein E2C01_006575 [Portunus trituberculatus]|uniref:Uncharacterized protein n=1 Tax=Portunus trituberculatus TaxID=210409 RepID=A0A5B7CVG1_PORTR|nr:hypothetical protein [Portunus trituberculatus]